MKTTASQLFRDGCKQLLYIYPHAQSPQELQRLEALQVISREQNIKVTYLAAPDSDNFSEIWSELSETLNHLQPQTGIIASWLFHFNLILGHLLNAHKGYSLACLTGLSQNQNSGFEKIYCNETGGTIYYSSLPTMEIGETCARSLLKLLENPEAITKVIIRPHELVRIQNNN